MAKRKIKNKVPSQKWKKYTISGSTVQRKFVCPKCGPGIFMAIHKDRVYCGKCHYVEMKRQ